jgi:hypothetical protein
MPYRALNAPEIVQTLETLERRISERFPDSGLVKVCHELVVVGRETQGKAEEIARPNTALRVALGIVVLAALSGLGYVIATIKLQSANTEVFGVFQGVEAAMNITVLAGAALFFAVSIEDRLKRRRALRELHTFRSIAHVIDMHQLTKDPSTILHGADPTASSPKRTMTRFELTRYLDYSSEMVSLTGKLAALYAQNMPDTVVIDAVNDIEELTANFSRKIWQKITIIESGAAAPPARPQAPLVATREGKQT